MKHIIAVIEKKISKTLPEDFKSFDIGDFSPREFSVKELSPFNLAVIDSVGIEEDCYLEEFYDEGFIPIGNNLMGDILYMEPLINLGLLWPKRFVRDLGASLTNFCSCKICTSAIHGGRCLDLTKRSNNDIGQT